MGIAEDAFDRLRRIAFEGEQAEKMVALGARTKLSPGVIKTLMRLSVTDGISMGEMARGIGCDPSYITALAEEIHAVLSIPPASFQALSRPELRQLRDLLDKVVEADPGLSTLGQSPPSLKATGT